MKHILKRTFHYFVTGYFTKKNSRLSDIILKLAYFHFTIFRLFYYYYLITLLKKRKLFQVKTKNPKAQYYISYEQLDFVDKTYSDWQNIYS